MIDNILLQPFHLQLWMYWMAFINFASVFFIFTSREARWILAFWFANLFLMELLYGVFGYTRILGVSHIILWTPLIIYLAGRVRQLDYSKLSSSYVIVLLVTNSISLILDYRDLFLWLGGERGAL